MPNAADAAGAPSQSSHERTQDRTERLLDSYSSRLQKRLNRLTQDHVRTMPIPAMNQPLVRRPTLILTMKRRPWWGLLMPRFRLASLLERSDSSSIPLPEARPRQRELTWDEIIEGVNSQ